MVQGFKIGPPWLHSDYIHDHCWAFCFGIRYTTSTGGRYPGVKKHAHQFQTLNYKKWIWLHPPPKKKQQTLVHVIIIVHRRMIGLTLPKRTAGRLKLNSSQLRGKTWDV